MSASEWDEAANNGWLTVEHVLNRLSAMTAYELGNGAEQGYGPDGFLVALTADSYVVGSNVKVHLNTNDHPPPHVHIEVRGELDSKLRLAIETGEPLDDLPSAKLRKKLNLAAGFVVEHKGLLLARWAECNPS